MAGWARCAALALLGWLAALGAAERPVQPLVLPMGDLLARLDPGRTWQFLPLADWQRLQGLAATAPAATAWGPDGGWTAGRAHLRIADGWVVGRAELDGIARVDRLPASLWLESDLMAASVDDRPALISRSDDGLFLSVVGLAPGPHRVVLTWATPITDPEQVQVALPAGVTEVAITAAEPLDLTGEGVVAAGAGWRVVPTSTLLDLRLRSRSAAGGPAVWGVRQSLRIDWRDDEGMGTWTVETLVRRGPAPAELEVRVPAGWTVLPAAGVAPMVLADGRLRLAPGAWPVVIDRTGTLAAPEVRDAMHQGLRAVVAGARVAPGPGWVADGDAWRIPAGSPGRIRGGRRLEAVRWQSRAEITPASWRVQEQAVLRPGTPVTRLTLTPPPGWRITDLTMAGWRPEQDLDRIEPGMPVVVVSPVPLAAPVAVSLAVAPAVDAPAVLWHPVLIDGAVADPVPVALQADDDLEVGVVAGAGWRIVEAAPLRLSALEPGRGLVLRRALRPLHGQVEAVAQVLPAASLGQEGGDWIRLDLRLVVHAGRPADLSIDGLAWDEIQVPAGWAATRAADRLVLAPVAPWRGERLVRLEGRLRGGAPVLPPAIRLRDGEDHGVVAAPPFLVLQSGGLADIEPESAEAGRSEDDLPAWSRPIPGATVVAVRRPGPATARQPWRWTVVRRALAAMPAGAVAEARVRVQVAPDCTRLWWRAEIAAPGTDALPVILPPGAVLVAATCDGQPAGIRAGSPPRVVLPGTSRTVLCLRVDLPAPGSNLVLAAPDVGLSVISSRWEVAVDGSLLARPVTAPDAVRLTGLDEGWPPGWGGIATPGLSEDLMPRPMSPVVISDPRRLVAPVAPPTVDQEPLLDLHGMIGRGSAGGMPVLRLSLVERDAVRTDQRWGWVLAAVIGLIVGWRWRARSALLVALAALCSALALRGAGLAAGPLLPALDLLPVMLVLGAGLARIRRWNTP